jgi:hypothetical protein
MLRSAPALLLILLAACGGASTAPVAPLNIAGRWQLQSSVASVMGDGLLGPVCQETGLVDVSQNGAIITAALSGSSKMCPGGSGAAQTGDDGPLGSGRISGDSVTFSNGVEGYNGTIQGSIVAGTVSGARATGTWQLTR